MKLLMCKPKKYFRANQRNCLKGTYLVAAASLRCEPWRS